MPGYGNYGGENQKIVLLIDFWVLRDNGGVWLGPVDSIVEEEVVPQEG